MKLRTLLARTGLMTAAVGGASLLLAPAAFAAGTKAGAVITNPANGTTITSGTSADPFEVRTDGPGFCTGSSNTGYFVTGYISDAPDTTTFTWDDTGPHATTGAATFALTGASGTYIGKPTNAPQGTDTRGAVLPSTASIGGPLDWSLYAQNSLLPPGSYHIGIACVGPGNVLDNYFETTIVLTGSSTAFSWTTPGGGVVPEVPYALLLPASGGAVLAAAGLYELRRRRQGGTVSAA